MKKSGIAMLMALGVGLAAGFGMAFTPSTAETGGMEVTQNTPVCERNSDCDYFCGEGYGHCVKGRYCACR